MKHFVTALILAASAATSDLCQAFTNLDFEAATVASNTPPSGFLDWNLAAPGWSHSSGSDTDIVYYGITHVGTTQWFLLVDSATQPGGPLSGSYAMRFASGRESGKPSAPWVNAYLSQTGVIPADARSLTLLANGPLAVSINGAVAPIISLGGAAFAVDVSSYSGSAVEIRFINTSQQLSDPVSIDAIDFSTSPVPEPPVWALLFTGAAVASIFRRARQSE
ncbi:PEP-CTERM sorting domain-containing protein [Roseateles sp. BYS180W]|uniref:PEP-CTERM sorting domain-containing protein n=1 Tax=Roseateles rivi TaxID=3299028 RepID=A0ABW7FYZ1_9BURK